MSKQDLEGSELWKEYVSVFKELSKYVEPDPIVMLGNSITQAFRVGEFIPGFYFLNRGIDGDTTAGLLNRLKSSVYDLNPSKLFILIGTNDLVTISNKNIISNYKEMLLEIISHCPACEIISISILPTKGLIDRPNKRITELNSELEKLAKQFDVKFLNVHPLFCDENNELKKEFSEDGLHLNQAGYNLLAKKVRSCL
jgi:lysophospholipase L1-like esterase